MALVRDHAFLCNSEGVQMIRDDIEKEGVTHVCIAACSRRAKTEAFHFPAVAMTRANLREGVIWVVAEGSEHNEVRQEMADDYVRMGCAEVKKMKLPLGNPNTTLLKSILVVGGGMSGLTAALEAAKAGYEVVIVEKQARLGGWANKLWKRVPFKGAYAEPQDTGVAALAAKVSAHPRIKVHLNSTVAETSGAPGRFTVKVAQESGAVTEEAIGAIIQATGFTTYDIAKLPELGGGQANVVDQAGLEALAQAANGGVLKRADGKEIKSVVFLQCAGSATKPASTFLIAQVIAVPPASSRQCISRTPTPIPTPWCCTPICACRAWARIFTVVLSRRASSSPRARPAALKPPVMAAR